MKVIAYKKEGLVFSYVLALLFSVFFIMVSFTAGPIFSIFGLLFLSIIIYNFFDIVNYPNEIIKIDDNKLYLPKGVVINIDDVYKIRHVCARSKHHTHKWGTIYIETHNVKYKCKYVDDCEAVCDRLKALTNYYEKLKY